MENHANQDGRCLLFTHTQVHSDALLILWLQESDIILHKTARMLNSTPSKPAQRSIEIKNRNRPFLCGKIVYHCELKQRDNNKNLIFWGEILHGRNLSVFHMHGYNFMSLTMLPECDSIYAIAWCISPPATLIYLCAAFIFWQFVSFDFITSALFRIFSSHALSNFMSPKPRISSLLCVN